MTAWWHRTCEDRFPKIEESGWVLQPHPHLTLGGLPFVWLTSTPHARRAELGLWSHTLECDRMSHLLRVVPEDEHHVVRFDDIIRSPQMAPYLPGARRLMAARGSKPGLWGVSSEPLRVEPVG